MPIKLDGSCGCGAVKFSVQSHTPHPYQLCYCSICQKTAGGGGFAINLLGTTASHSVKGKKVVGGEYHGHVRLWGDLEPDMRAALKPIVVVDKRGRMTINPNWDILE